VADEVIKEALERKKAK